MKYELINPSDNIHFEAKDFEVAAVATLLVGRGKYAAKPEGKGSDAAPEVPILMFGGLEEWTAQTFSCNPGDLIKRVSQDKRPALIRTLRSFKIEGGERSSLNDICGYAHAYAKSISKVEPH